VTAAMPIRGFMSIGDVLAKLRPDFPDVTISKIRFLESEGLVEPQRTPSGYRKFSFTDLERLRYVLAAQRDHYLPLRVIKDNLGALDRGLTPADSAGHGPLAPRSLMAGDEPSPMSAFPDAGELRLHREELLEAASIDNEFLRQLEDFCLVAAKPPGTLYDGNAVLIASIAGRMNTFGLEPRHLRAFKTAADRETGLIEQVVTPLLSQRNPQAKGQAGEIARELAALSTQLHAALVTSLLRSGLTR
jgi:DNA-binding transcriptional MerR regulator